MAILSGLASVGKFLLGGGLLGAGIKALTKRPRADAPMGAPTRDDAAAAMAREDALRARRGNAADMLVSGSAGAEAMGVGKLVVGN